MGAKEVTGEGVEEERGKGKRDDGDVKTCVGVGARCPGVAQPER